MSQSRILRVSKQTSWNQLLNFRTLKNLEYIKIKQTSTCSSLNRKQQQQQQQQQQKQKQQQQQRKQTHIRIIWEIVQS